MAVRTVCCVAFVIFATIHVVLGENKVGAKKTLTSAQDANVHLDNTVKAIQLNDNEREFIVWWINNLAAHAVPGHDTLQAVQQLQEVLAGTRHAGNTERALLVATEYVNIWVEDNVLFPGLTVAAGAEMLRNLRTGLAGARVAELRPRVRACRVRLLPYRPAGSGPGSRILSENSESEEIISASTRGWVSPFSPRRAYYECDRLYKHALKTASAENLGNCRSICLSNLWGMVGDGCHGGWKQETSDRYAYCRNKLLDMNVSV